MSDEKLVQNLTLLRNGFKEELCEFINSNEKFEDLMQELVMDFVEKNIPLVQEDHKTDLALLMIEGTSIRPC